MILNDKLIETYGKTLIEPFNAANVQPGSYDVTLGNTFLVQEFSPGTFVLAWDKPEYKRIRADVFTILPHQFVLATTAETVKVPADVTAFIHGRSSVGRAGLFIQNAGLIDAGFVGQLTLEFYNASENAIAVHAGQRIGQITFETMSSPAEHPYRGKYQNQKGATASKMYKDAD